MCLKYKKGRFKLRLRLLKFWEIVPFLGIFLSPKIQVTSRIIIRIIIKKSSKVEVENLMSHIHFFLNCNAFILNESVSIL